MDDLKPNLNTIYYWMFQQRGLSINVASSPRGAVMVALRFRSESDSIHKLIPFVPNAELIEDRSHNEGIIGIIEAYLNGDNPAMDIPWDIHVTAFMYNAYKSACTIPYGETRTYKDIAITAGAPGGARAVGQALKRNPLCIIIPCHRVVAADGLGGFNAGIDMKKYLLNLEFGQRVI
jgi:methylated-DNA-[protein]-cysteine S-methyltransferase